MKNIVINESYLRKLHGTYTKQVDEIDLMYGKNYPYGSLPDSTVDITKQFKLRLGGKGFTEAEDLTGAIDVVRAGLANRLKGARTELNNLEHGIKFLLADSDAVEQTSTLSAEQFEYFMPKAGG
ncbi:hypothetical protein GA0074692_2708 [Micromonospora pallida]|uniref:Uncharacterized protein n=1 Tax=Micromonospora pallida TaxID=145854 RepID=A0A1C6SIG9_9ACTN|nr:hypothetical protein [Micromonospora pallida]SCL29340.1 hypothetical protein GA0074692_2708 [Micromonospora pallida]